MPVSPTAESTYRALLLDVMVAMMEEDGVMDDREVEIIGDVYEEIVGFRLENSVRRKLIGSVAESRYEILMLLQSRAAILNDSHRRSILRAAMRVLRVDGSADPKEWQFLRDVGLALGMTEEEIDAVLS